MAKKEIKKEEVKKTNEAISESDAIKKFGDQAPSPKFGDSETRPKYEGGSLKPPFKK